MVEPGARGHAVIGIVLAGPVLAQALSVEAQLGTGMRSPCCGIRGRAGECRAEQ